MFFSQVKIRIKASAIARNYSRLAAIGKNVMPVIKADAYGHGLETAARVLSQAGARALAVGTVDEAVRLRDSGFGGPIISLLGPLDSREAWASWEARVTPFVCRMEQLRFLQETSQGREPLPVALKFDTGMGRLGFSWVEAAQTAAALPRLESLRPVMAASHLAVADEPGSRDFTLEQGRLFRDILDQFRLAGVEVQGCLANSAGLLAYPELHFDIQRPGLTLYGCNPFHGTAWESKGGMFEPAMAATAPVLQVHDLPRGRTISYGRKYTAAEDMRVAIVGAGYSDFYSRALSSTGGRGAAMVLHGRRAPVLGRVCMQLTAVDVTRIPEATPGDEAWLLGGPGAEPVTAEEMAGWRGTISYEVLTNLGLNARIQVEG